MKPILPFGKYLLLERISVGGMAEVFKARAADDENGRLLAIKRILPSMAEDADFITMFIDEARISGQLNHPHIAQIYELSKVSDSHFIAMEYVWGKDVLQMQNRFRRLKSVMPFPMAGFIAAKMCEALDYAHKKKGPDGHPLGIIHRDVSPQNVLVSYEGEVKVIDFGIAKAASRSTKTQAGVLKGKFGYMSPEQVSGLPLDRRSDVFAIGTILYEMITADRLFIAESDFATLEKVRNVDVRPPVEAVPTCPRELDRIIRKALSKAVEERYQWADEMAADLQFWLASLPQAFSEHELSAWMQEHFGVEMKREGQALEEQQAAALAHIRGVSAIPVAAAASVSAASTAPVALAAGGSPVVVPHGTQEIKVEDVVSAELAADAATGEFGGQSTQILDPGVHPPAEAVATPLSAQATMIADGGQVQAAVLAAVAAAGGMPEMSGESTRILESSDALPSLARPMEEMPSQATAILDASAMKLPPFILPTPQPQIQIAPVPQPMHISPAPNMRGPMGGPGGQLAFHPPTTRVESPLPYVPPRSTVRSDILIGFAVAAVIVGGTLGFRYWKQGPRGTLVIVVSPPSAALVSVDGVMRGGVDSGKAMTINDVPAGRHLVDVKAPIGNYSDTVDVVGGEISAVTATLTPAPGSMAAAERAAPERSPSAAAEKPAAAPEKAPVVAAADKPAADKPAPSQHAADNPATIEKPAAGDEPAADKPAADKPVAPAPKPVITQPGKGHLVVRTEPSGADVSINGKPVGVSPVERGDIPLGKPVRVTLRKKGYATVAKYLDFDKENDRVLDVALLDLKSGQPPTGQTAEPPAAEPPAPAAERPAATPAKPAAAPTVAPARPAAADKPGTPAARPAAEAAAPAAKPAAASPTPAAAPAAAPAPNPNDPGFLVANTQPWAKVLIDGRDTGKSTPIAPLSKLPLKPGKHTVTFVVDGKKYSFPIDVKPGEITRLIKTLGGEAPAATP